MAGITICKGRYRLSKIFAETIFIVTYIRYLRKKAKAEEKRRKGKKRRRRRRRRRGKRRRGEILQRVEGKR